jgi:hypothetical protein
VRRRDDDAGLQAQGASEVRNGRRRHRSDQADIDTGSGKPGFERRLEHVARDPGVLADQHRWPVARLGMTARTVARSQDPTRSMSQPHDKLGRDRRLADAPADAIGAKILSRHGFLSP